MKHPLNKSSILIYALVLGALSTLLTGCIIWPWHDHGDEHRDHYESHDHDDHDHDHHG